MAREQNQRRQRVSRDAVQIRILREPEADDLPLPAYATPGSAGLDICAAIPIDKPIVMLPGERALITTGFRFEVPYGCELQVRPRSGLAIKYGVSILNAPGTIDSDYRGVVQIILINWGAEPFTVRRGDRIAQIVPARITFAALSEVEILEMTDRGEGGFGSTGDKLP